MVQSDLGFRSPCQHNDKGVYNWQLHFGIDNCLLLKLYNYKQLGVLIEEMLSNFWGLRLHQESPSQNHMHLLEDESCLVDKHSFWWDTRLVIYGLLLSVMLVEPHLLVHIFCMHWNVEHQMYHMLIDVSKPARGTSRLFQNHYEQPSLQNLTDTLQGLR